jgi:hypothetical protein
MSLFDSPPLREGVQPSLNGQPKKENEIVPDAKEVPNGVPSLGPSNGSLTVEMVQNAVPNHLRTSVTQEMVDNLNSIATDPIIAENIRANFVGYSAILKDGKFKTEEYINAVTYVSFKLMGYTNLEAYTRTFPHRYASLVARNTATKDIAGYVSAFNRGKLVNLIMEQSLVPTWVLNQDIYQKAINIQADLMMNSHSDKVRTDAANSILNHLKKPETKEFQISMDTNESAGIKEMRTMLTQLASQQRELIERGTMKTIDVAATRLVVEEDEDGKS